MSQQEPPSSLLDGYITEQEAARQRGKSERCLRDERQRGVGPPYTRDGRKVLYDIAKFRAWLRANECIPVRSEQRTVSKPERHRASAGGKSAFAEA